MGPVDGKSENPMNVEWNKIIHAADLVGRAKESEFIDNFEVQKIR